MDLNSQSRPYLCLAIRATFTFSYPWKVLSAASRFPCFTVGLASPLKLLITMVPATFCCLVYLIILINNQITMHETSLYSGAKKSQLWKTFSLSPYLKSPWYLKHVFLLFDAFISQNLASGSFFKVVPVFFEAFMFILKHFLLFGISRCSRFILYFFYSRHEITHF